MFENRVCVTIQKKVGQDRPKFFAKLFLKTIWTWAPGCQVLSLSLLFKCRSKLLEVGCQVLFHYPSFANTAASFGTRLPGPLSLLCKCSSKFSATGMLVFPHQCSAKKQWNLAAQGCQIFSLAVIRKMQQQASLHLSLQKQQGTLVTSGCQFSAIYHL